MYLFFFYLVYERQSVFPQFDLNKKKLTICAKQQLLEMHLINYSKTTFDLWAAKYRYLEVNTPIVCTMFSKINK